MQQRSFGSVEYEHKKVKTRRQTFLERMDRLVPWAELEVTSRKLVSQCTILINC